MTWTQANTGWATPAGVAAAGGGGITAAAQNFVPTSFTPVHDPNSIVASASQDGNWILVNAQNPGTFPLISDGAVFDCGPLRNFEGESVTIDPITAVSLLGIEIESVPGTQLRAWAIIADGQYGAYTRAVATGLLANGANLEPLSARDFGAGWNSSGIFTGAGSSTARRVWQQYAATSHTAIAQKSSILLTASAGTSHALARETTTGVCTFNRAMLAVSWTSATGASAGPVRFRPFFFGANSAKMSERGC